MKLLKAALHPMSLDDLKTHYDEGKCLVLDGLADKFHDLVSPEDIERRLNDGCNVSTMVQVIKDGSRGANAETTCVWSAASLRKKDFTADIKANNSFMMPNSSQITPAISQLIDEIEEFFKEDNVHADVHLYCSTSNKGNSYNAHRDVPQHKILLQAYGDTNWQLFKSKKEIPAHISAIPNENEDEWLEMVSEFTLKQGSLLYMPPGTFHKVVSVEGARISISIPFYTMNDAVKMDRSFIPFAEIFRINLNQKNKSRKKKTKK